MRSGERRRIVALVVRMAVGLVLIGAGWWGARDEVALDRQTPWVAVAVTGTLVAAASAALWLLTARRAVATRIAAMVLTVGFLPEAPALATGDDLRVRRRGAATRMFHRPGCELVAGRRVQRGTRDPWIDSGLEPCEACRA